MNSHVARWLLKLIQHCSRAHTHTYNPTTAGTAGQTDRRHRQPNRQTLATLLPGSPPAPWAQAAPDTSPAAAQAQGQKATPSTGKMGSHQLYVKLSWNCAIRTGTTWKRKLITLLFLIIQRQIDTSSETLARRYLFPFHNKVKTHKDSEKNQNQQKQSHKQVNRLACSCCLPSEEHTMWA